MVCCLAPWRVIGACIAVAVPGRHPGRTAACHPARLGGGVAGRPRRRNRCRPEGVAPVALPACQIATPSRARGVGRRDRCRWRPVGARRPCPPRPADPRTTRQAQARQSRRSGIRKEAASVPAPQVREDSPVDVSEADWRKCGSCGGGADRRAQTDITCVPMSMGPTLAAPSKRLSSRRSSIFKASGFGPAMPCHA